MRVIKIFLMVVFLLAYSQAWAKDKQKSLKFDTGTEVSNVYEKDDTGLIYRGGVDMNPPSGELPEVGIGAPVSIGCGKFDFGLNLKNAMTAEAMQDYVSTLGANVLAASPWLLLEYINPTYADALKHIQGITYQRLPGLYNDCDTIVAEGTDLIHKLKKASDAGKINSGKEGGDISGEMRKLKETGDLAGLKDYNGNLIGTREHRLIKEGLEWAKAEEGTLTLSEDIAGDIVISGKSVGEASVTKVLPKKDIGQYLSDLKQDLYGEIVKLMERREGGGTISRDELDTVSSESTPLTNLVLRSWSTMDAATREIEIRKYASTVAMAQLSNRTFTLVNKLITASTNINKTDVEKELIREKANEVQSRIVALRDLRGEEIKLAETVSDSLDESADALMDAYDSSFDTGSGGEILENLQNEGDGI